MKKYFYIITFLILFTPFLYTEGSSSTGFIPGQIWYSQDSIKEGDTIKIYTGIWNIDSAAISAKVEFYNKNIVLGTRDVVVPSMQLKEVSISWKVTPGDHLISAKIIPPTIIANSKKEIIVPNINTISGTRLFVPVAIKTGDGGSSTSSDLIKSQIDKATASIGGILPDSVSAPIAEQVGVVNAFRVDTLEKISSNKTAVEKEIDILNKAEKNKTVSTDKSSISITNDKKTNESVVLAQTKSAVEDSTQKPIAYIKLFFLSILYFIFGSQTIFYLFTALVVFIILRFFYRKIRNK